MDFSSGQTYGRQMGQPQGQTLVSQTSSGQQEPLKQQVVQPQTQQVTEKKDQHELQPPHHPIPDPFILRVVEARGLTRTDMSGAADPYVYIKFKKGLLTSTKLLSRVVERSLNPVWNEEFVLHPRHPDTDVIQIYVYDKDRLGRDTVLGKVLLPAAQYWKRGIIDEWIPLQGKRKSNQFASGELHILVFYDQVEKSGLNYGSSSVASSAYASSSTSSAALPSQTPSTMSSSSYLMAPPSTPTREYFYPSSQYTSSPSGSNFSTSGSTQAGSSSIAEGLYPPPVRVMEMPSLQQLQQSQQSQQPQQIPQFQQSMQYQQPFLQSQQFQQPPVLMRSQPQFSSASMTPVNYPLGMSSSSSVMSPGYTPLSGTSSYPAGLSSFGSSSLGSGLYPAPMASHHD